MGERRQKRTPPPDQADRDAAIFERRRNVLVDAGAGTGKTSTLVSRLVEMVAPENDRHAAKPIGRIAAVTFTRRAAGDLRLRVRERILRALAEEKPSPKRRKRLHDALGGLDTAHIGTTHGFADRLLRLRPVEAELSPSYEIVDEPEDLVRETHAVLLHAAESGTLADVLGAAAGPVALRAAEAEQTILAALRANVRAESRVRTFRPEHGLDSLVGGFVEYRDVPPEDPPLVEADIDAFRRKAEELIGLVAAVRGRSPGARWLVRLGRLVGRQMEETDAATILGAIVVPLTSGPGRKVTKRDTFKGDDAAWRVWKRLCDGLGAEVLAPLHRWLAIRLVRLFPVVVALYDAVEARHRAVDQLDLLLKLRDVLRDDLGARAFYQSLFDHVFVDEFQDTDPLQAEIVLYLCEREPRAASFADVRLADGKLTLVGDPKQSIYRFRRADVAMYDQVRRIVASRDHLAANLSCNFRSVPGLIGWFNDRFEAVLGTPPDDDTPFDPETGRVFHRPLRPGRSGATEGRVHVVPFEIAGRGSAGDYRRLEARVMARYLRWLVDESGIEVADPLDDSIRTVRYGDVAVLALETTNLDLLFPELDRLGIPHASRGGRMFLSEPLHRRFLLGLRAIADRDDGIAEAALLRPPFFAVDLGDLVRHRADRGSNRVAAARERIRDLRRRRLLRPPGETARDLLEKTAFGRFVALGPNGAQRLERLRELCLVLEQRAADGGFDYDAVTAEMREWIDEPVQLDPPNPVATEAVQVVTVHQAKGLEFPVVVLWDGRAKLERSARMGAWKVERDGRGWHLGLHRLVWNEPPGLDLARTEKSYQDAERRRLVYVAATRARDLLVVPKAGQTKPGLVCGALLADAPEGSVVELEPTIVGAEGTDATMPAWAREIVAPEPAEWGDASDVEEEVGKRWSEAVAEAGRPRFQPSGVSAETHAAPIDPEDEPTPEKRREGRYGPVFGSTVHRAIELALRRQMPAVDAVAAAAKATGLESHLDEAAMDVRRALEALGSEGLLRPPGPDLRLEYPIAVATDDGKLLSGYVDFVSATADRLDVVDFKTDAPPTGEVEETHADYVEQVRTYARLLVGAGLGPGRTVRRGLLFTADGRIRWV